MWTLPVILGLLVIVMTAVPLSKHQAWWVRVFDFPRLQIVFVGALALILYLLLIDLDSAGDALFLALLIFSLGYQAFMIYPYTRLARVQTEQSFHPDPDSTISLLFANVQENNRETNSLKTIIREVAADMVLLVETDDWWLHEMEPEFRDYPYRVLQPQSNTYGMLLFSKLELIDPEVNFLIQEDIPSIHGRVRLPSGKQVEFRCLHPRPPVPTEFESAGPRDAEIIIVGRQNREDDMPFIVFGDLNDVAWSRTNYLFQNISGLLDPRVGRGFYHTFHAKIPFLRFPLDHLFHSNHFRVVDFRRLAYFGSDHFPVYSKLSLEPDAVITQEELVPDEEEVREAQEKAAYAEEVPPPGEPIPQEA
jgi:endonuclease/exonuclease/phosphatase (EEP) superfamily protein YafD